MLGLLLFLELLLQVTRPVVKVEKQIQALRLVDGHLGVEVDVELASLVGTFLLLALLLDRLKPTSPILRTLTCRHTLVGELIIVAELVLGPRSTLAGLV